MTYRLFWNSTDGQASLHMGDFASEQEALDAVSGAAAELEAQGGTAEGRWTVDFCVTDAQIRQLRAEAGSAGDSEMVALCDAALDGDLGARRICERALRSAQEAAR